MEYEQTHTEITGSDSGRTGGFYPVRTRRGGRRTLCSSRWWAQPDGLIPRILTRMEIDVEGLKADLEREIGGRPRQTGGPAEPESACT